MRQIVFVLMFVLAGSAMAGSIYDVQTGVYTIDDEVIVEGAIVTGVRYNGVFISEDVVGPYTGVWVYTGFDPAVGVGDLVDVKGVYTEYYDLTEIDVSADLTGYFTYVGAHDGALSPAYLTIATLNADPEPWECCFISVSGQMIVSTPPSQYGEWEVESLNTPGQFLSMDDYWFDPANVLEGDCLCCATGILFYSFGAFKLQPFDGSICFLPCIVPNEDMSFGAVKALYR